MICIKNYFDNLNEVGKIVFYKDGVKVEVEHHHLESKSMYVDKEGVLKTDFLKEIISIDPGTDFKRALKENLNRKDNYYINYKPDYYFSTKKALYIHCDFEIVEHVDHVWKDSGETAYINTVNAKIPVNVKYINREEIPYDPNFKLPDGARWYETFGPDNTNNTYKVVEIDNALMAKKHKGKPDKFIVHFTETFKTEENLFLKLGCYTRIEYTEERKKENDLISEIRDNLKVDISAYDLRKLLKHYNLTKKAEE